jgi:membrane associated rhomboid family serine protease
MTRWVLRLIMANVIVYFLELASPQVINLLLFVPMETLYRPWTVVTYMFLHDPSGFGHIFFNMLSLWFFGPRVEDRLGGRAFLGLYFTSGIGGALLSLLLAPYSPILGASGAVFGVLLGYAWFWPRNQMLIWGIIPIEARWMVLVMTGLSLWGGYRGAGGIAHFAHLGGFLGGYIFLRLLARRSGAERFRRQSMAPVRRLETTSGSVDRWTKIPREKLHEVNREELDRILDKIGASGVSSLTPGEREFLDRFSTRH